MLNWTKAEDQYIPDRWFGCNEKGLKVAEIMECNGAYSVWVEGCGTGATERFDQALTLTHELIDKHSRSTRAKELAVKVSLILTGVILGFVAAMLFYPYC